ncbi:hypothetical protein [Arthrobacter sp. Marseille-P9274]|uniref:hypothetical protein n=1 Tax=Arthrobacter sp. Marseille-P9274 TaxID=2866572 RepID=UPI0021C62EFE|nr:hypothetical protein [Arthrobacter sp. Marseille-P9274]
MNRAVSHNDDDVRHLLEEAGLQQTAPLEASLMALRAAGHEPMKTAPSPELLAFMGPAAAPATGVPATSVLPDPEAPATSVLPVTSAAGTAAAPKSSPESSPTGQVIPLRRRRTVRGAALGLAVVAATGLGVSGVAAASPEFRAAAGTAVDQVVGFFDPSDDGRQAGPSTDGKTGESDAPQQPAGGNPGDSSGTGAADRGTAGSGAEAEETSGGSRSADETGRNSGSGSESGSGNPAEPAPLPEQAGNGAVKDPGSIPSEAGDATKKLLEDARETQPSDVVPSLPEDDVLPAPGKPDSDVKDVPALPKDAPQPNQ